MEIQKFIENFAAQFDETDIVEFKAETKFHDIGEWSSLTALSVMAMVDEEYNINIKGEDIRNSTTINDLFEIIKSRS